MTDSGSDYPAADCWLLNTVPSPEHLNEHCDNNAPPAILKFVVPGSEGDAPLESDIELRWAPDGHSVALLVKGTPLGFIAQGNKHGYSKNLVTASPFGMLFEQELYERLFPCSLLSCRPVIQDVHSLHWSGLTTPSCQQVGQYCSQIPNTESAAEQFSVMHVDREIGCRRWI
ncbi:hypothetical protein ACK3Y8_13220 [Aeromonas caviae]